jgi:hypothetical protein
MALQVQNLPKLDQQAFSPPTWDRPSVIHVAIFFIPMILLFYLFIFALAERSFNGKQGLVLF